MNQPEILFVSHDAGRTGAPLILLNFQRWLKKHTSLQFATILRRAGPLEPEFAALGETFLIRSRRWERLVRERIADHFNWSFGSEKRLAGLRSRPHQLIYSNTVTNGDILPILARPGVKVLTHVHELNYWIDRTGPKNWSNVCRHTTKFVAVSEAVSRNLQERHHISADRLEVVHEFIPVDERDSAKSFRTTGTPFENALTFQLKPSLLVGAATKPGARARIFLFNWRLCFVDEIRPDLSGLSGSDRKAMKKNGGNSNTISRKPASLIVFAGLAKYQIRWTISPVSMLSLWFHVKILSRLSVSRRHCSENQSFASPVRAAHRN